MANRLMSAYGNLASARTDIGRNLSDIAGIGIEMEYGSEGRIAGQMEQSRIANQTAAIGLGLESIQQIAGFGVEYDKETEAAESVGGKEVYKKRIKDESTGEYTTEWGDKGNLFQKLGRFLGFSERQFNVEGQRYTGAQVEAAVPYTKIGKTWAEAAGLTGGGTKIPGQNEPEAIWEGSFEDLGMTESEFDSSPRRVRDYNVKPLGGITDERTNVLYDEEGKPFKYIDETIFDNSTPKPVTTSKYSDMTFSQYLKDTNRDQSLINQLMSGGWASATEQWKESRKTLK